jgi:hypothetical protein
VESSCDEPEPFVYTILSVYVPADGIVTDPAPVIVLSVPVVVPDVHVIVTTAVVPVAGSVQAEIVKLYGDGNVVIHEGDGAAARIGVIGGVATPMLIIGNGLLTHGTRCAPATFCLIL